MFTDWTKSNKINVRIFCWNTTQNLCDIHDRTENSCTVSTSRCPIQNFLKPESQSRVTIRTNPNPATNLFFPAANWLTSSFTQLCNYWVAVGEARRKMTKLRNSYPEDIACVLCFPRIVETTEESTRGQSEDCLCCQFLEWKLQIDLTVNKCNQSELISSFIRCCSSTGRVYSADLSSETFRVTSAS